MKRCLLMGFVLAGLACGAVHAQTLEALRGNASAHYRFADASDVTMQIKVWGDVEHPGFYEVREGLTLSTVLSLAGGPRAPAQPQSTVSTFTVRLFRLQTGDQYQLFTETRMENELGALNSDPVLVQGDMVITGAKTRQRFSWRDGVSLMTAVGTLVIIVQNAFLN